MFFQAFIFILYGWVCINFFCVRACLFNGVACPINLLLFGSISIHKNIVCDYLSVWICLFYYFFYEVDKLAQSQAKLDYLLNLIDFRQSEDGRLLRMECYYKLPSSGGDTSLDILLLIELYNSSETSLEWFSCLPQLNLGLVFDFYSRLVKSSNVPILPRACFSVDWG